jgi:enterochelin esterase-like enzyme
MTHNLIRRALSEPTPFIDGDTVTFVWRGRRPPHLIGDFTDWEDGTPATLSRITPSVWVYQLTLPADAYMEYAYVDGEERLPDPFNPRTITNGVGKFNHYFYMPGAAPTPLAERNPEVRHGLVTRHVVRCEDMIASGRRTVYLYRPPVGWRVPLVVVWDGSDYLRRARLPAILDNLIAQQRIHPVALAMIQNGGRARAIEYACSEVTLGFLIKCVIPLAQANLRLTKIERGGYGVLGASMGGLMALYTALRLPHIFGNVLSQSGAFGSEERDSVVFDLLRYGPHLPIKIWMDVGHYDFPDLLAANQRMDELLMEKGYPVIFRQYNGGHNFPSWRDDVWRGMEELFQRGE